MADGPVKFVGNVDGDLNIVPITRFGRSFSVVNVPYAFKLLYQELQALNIQMRLITSDNVEQLTALTDSGNIIKLTGNLTTLNDVKAETQRRLFAAEKEEKADAAEKRAMEPSPDTPATAGPFAPPSAIQQIGDTVVWQGHQGINPFAPPGVQIPTETMVPAQVPGSPPPYEGSPISSPEYVPISPESGTPDSGPGYVPPSPTPSPQSPEWVNLPSTGEMIIWNGDPQPGRVWRVAEISIPDHTMIIIPGSFTGPDRITIPFKDAHPLPTQSPHSTGYDYGDDEYGFMDYGPQDTLTGDPKFYNPALAKRISEVGYSEAFREQKEKVDEHAKTTLSSSKGTQKGDEGDEGEGDEGSGSGGKIPKPIIIRTPVVEKDDEGLDLLSAVDKEKEEKDAEPDTKKLITKKD